MSVGFNRMFASPYFEPVVYCVIGGASAIVLGFSFSPHPVCKNFNSIIAITSVGIGALTFIANLWNRKAHTEVDEINQGNFSQHLLALIQNTKRGLWQTLYPGVHILAGHAIMGGFAMRYLPRLICSASSIAFPIIGMTVCAGGLALNLYNTCLTQRILAIIKDPDNESVEVVGAHQVLPLP